MKRPVNAMEVFLQPGDWYFGDHQTSIRTLLGSCVAIVLWHPRRYLGGMCHYMLPARAKPRAPTAPPDGRYADEALDLLLEQVIRHGTRPQDYQVKLFGGGNMFPGLKADPDDGVAARNIKAGMEMVRQHGFRIGPRHLGGTGHRQVIFNVWSGDVWVKHLELEP